MPALVGLVFLTAPGLAVSGLVLVYRYREWLKGRLPYAYYGLISGIVICYSGVFFYSFFILSEISVSLIILAEAAMLGVFLTYRYRVQLKSRSQYVYHGLLIGSVILGVVAFSLIIQHDNVSGCNAIPSIFAGGLHTLVSVTATSVTFLCTALLYLFRRPTKEKAPHVFYGLIAIMLLVGGSAVIISTSPVYECGSSAGVDTSQQDTGGVVKIRMVVPGNLDSMGLVGPDGTRSTMVNVEAGTNIKLRSNEEVMSYLNNPRNNITVSTISGTKTVENVSELPSEYQKAPDGLTNPDADIGNYANASVATVGCLFDHGGIEMGGRQIPANVSIPCNMPVLAQNESMLAQNDSTRGPPIGIIIAILVVFVTLVALYRYRELLKTDRPLGDGQSESRHTALYVLELICVILLVGALIAGIPILEHNTQTDLNAQEDSTTVGTSVKPTSGPNAGKTLTSPVILREGEYSVIGKLDGEEHVLQTFEASR